MLCNCFKASCSTYEDHQLMKKLSHTLLVSFTHFRLQYYFSLWILMTVHILLIVMTLLIPIMRIF